MKKIMSSTHIIVLPFFSYPIPLATTSSKIFKWSSEIGYFVVPYLSKKHLVLIIKHNIGCGFFREI